MKLDQIVDERYGIPADAPVKKAESLSDIIQRAMKNAVKATPPPAQEEWDAERIGRAFISYYTQYVNFRNKQLIAGDDFMQRMQDIVEWIAGGMYEYRWLYLTGDVGNGKSTTSHAICAVLQQMGNKFVSKKAADIALLYRYIDDNKKALDEWNRLCMTPVLEIDDFGTEKPDCMMELLDKRYDNMAITIFSSNISLQDCTRYGNRIYDRMLELTQEVVFYEDSYRPRR